MATLRISKAALKATTKLPTKKTRVTKKRPAKKIRRPTLSNAQTPKARTDALIEQIRNKLTEMHATAYDIGKALISLRKPEIWKLYGETSFKGFIQEQIMPYSTAARLVTFAETYTKKTALQIGLERGVQLTRLARIKELGAPETLWKKNAIVAKKPRRRVKQTSAAELERLVRAALLQKAKKTATEATEAEREAVDTLEEWWIEASDFEADFELDLKRRKVLIELDLDELLA